MQEASPQPAAPPPHTAMTPDTNKLMPQKLIQALSAFQGELQPAELDRENSHFHNKYATLTSIMAAIRPGLQANGLAIIQRPSYHERGAALTTTIAHISGESISSTFVVPLGKPDAQGLGSAITYARRYAICSMLGVVADEDDDGNAAAENAREAAARQQNDRRNGSQNRGNDRQPPPRGQANGSAQRPQQQQRPAQTAPKGVTREMLGELLRVHGDKHNDGVESKELFVKAVRYQLHCDAGFENLQDWNLDSYGTIAKWLGVNPVNAGGGR